MTWRNGDIEALTFDLAGETFALEAVIVQEILDVVQETVVPGSPPLVGAVINFRGKVIPLSDLRLAFGLEVAPPTIDSRIIVIALELEGENTLIGVKADRVNEVTALKEAAAERPPEIGMRYRPEYIRWLVKLPHGLTVLPDLVRIFSQPSETDAPRPAAQH